MNVCLFCFSDAGAKLALKVCGLLGLAARAVHSTEKFAKPYGFTAHKRIADDMGALFGGHDALIFIGACGIAVREIAPHLKSKTTDPAVLVLDDRGGYVIPILSGHIGGANRLAGELAERLGAVPVITTATDGAGRFSCDAWAAAHDCAISSMEAAKAVSAAILKADVPVCADSPLPERLPDGLIRGEEGEIGIYIGVYERSPFCTTLRLIPRTLTLGIGCRRGIGREAVLSAAEAVAGQYGFDLRAVGMVASIDLKRDEEGLLAFAKALGAETVFYTADELNAVEGDFEESEFVKKTVGTGNVCERAAVLAGGKRIVRKTAVSGVTVAVAEKERRIEF